MTNLIIIFTIIGGLILFAWQNLSPSLALTFFGWQSATLPLSVWILIAIAAGFFSAIFISSLFQVFQSLSRPDYPSSSSTPDPIPPRYNQNVEQQEAEQFDEPNHSQWQVKTPPVTPAVEAQRSNSQILAEDWETDVRPLDPSWSSTTQSTTPEGRFNLDKEQRYSSEIEEDDENWVDDDSRQSRSESMYAYGDRNPNESGVGQSESVYDADYRVIVPPSNTQIQPDDDDEDWIEDEPEESPDLRKH